ncbi:MAG TPA: hypothetical protein VHQ90_25560 [Thermoanaerobaculia bacterium]|nr:hypothetical protein [Thermoanaerobaculia bacterium]
MPREEENYRLSEAQAPRWSLFGVWLEREGVVLLTDISSGSIVHISLHEQILRQVRASRLSSKESYKPRKLVRWSRGGFLLQLVNGPFVWLDDSYHVKKQISFDGFGNSLLGVIDGIWSWCEVAGKILAIADIRRPDGTYYSALVELDPRDRSKFSLLHTMTDDDQNRQYARMGFSFLCSIGKKAYALLVDQQPGVYELNGSVRRLRDFPQGFNNFPRVSKIFAMDNIASIYNALQEKAMVVGLFRDGKYLDLLLRRPTGGGRGTYWSVARLDPLAEKIVDVADLPSESADLLVFPGDASWALIEKGPVTGWKMQTVEAVKRIPSPFRGREQASSLFRFAERVGLDGSVVEPRFGSSPHSSWTSFFQLHATDTSSAPTGPFGATEVP